MSQVGEKSAANAERSKTLLQVSDADEADGVHAQLACRLDVGSQVIDEQTFLSLQAAAREHLAVDCLLWFGRANQIRENQLFEVPRHVVLALEV